MTPQVEDFEFNTENQKKVQEIIKRYPEGRQASAVLPLLDLAQRQQGGWLPQGAMDRIAHLLSMPSIRVYEVASFYSMFNLKPVGRYLIQVCTTTPCGLRGAEDLVKVCHTHLKGGLNQVTADGLFTYKEVECLGACVNGPVVQINDDYVEDLDPDSFIKVLEMLKEGKPCPVGSVQGRQGSRSQPQKKGE